MLLELILASPALLCGGIVVKRVAAIEEFFKPVPVKVEIEEAKTTKVKAIPEPTMESLLGPVTLKEK